MSKKTLTVLQAILLLATIVLFSSCESEEDVPDTNPDAYVRANPNPLTFSAEGGTQYLYIESSYVTAHEQYTSVVKLFEANSGKNLICKKVKQEDKRQTWEVTCPPNYTNEAREFVLVAKGSEEEEHGPVLATDFIYYIKTDTILVKQEAGNILAKLADLKIDVDDIVYEIRNEDSNWQYDDDPTMLSQPYLDEVKGKSFNLAEPSKKVVNTRVVDGKYLVDLDLEYPNTWAYDPDDNIPRLGADNLHKIKLSLTIGINQYDKFVIENGTLNFNEEGTGTFTNPINGASGSSEYATHIEVKLSNIPCNGGPASILEDNIRAIDFDSDWDWEDNAVITGTGYKKFFAMPNSTEIKPATAKSGDNKQWRFKFTLVYE